VHRNHRSWRKIDDHGSNVTEVIAHLEQNQKSGADENDVASARNVTGKRRKLEVGVLEPDARKVWTLSTSWT
jgi:hypothetical protein